MTTATHTARVDVEQLVQTELAWSPSRHPRAIAERVAASIDDSSLRTALAAALVYVVRRVASRNRQAAAGVTGTKPDAAKLLDQPVCLGPRGWSSYGRLTPTEVGEQITWQRQLAERANAEATRLDRIAEAMEAAEVGHVDELGLATLSAIFS